MEPLQVRHSHAGDSIILAMMMWVMPKLHVSEQYSVQLLLDDGTVDKANVRTIEASTPLSAGEEAVGAPLALHGTRPRAIVRWMNPAYVAFVCTLYDPQPREQGT